MAASFHSVELRIVGNDSMCGWLYQLEARVADRGTLDDFLSVPLGSDFPPRDQLLGTVLVESGS